MSRETFVRIAWILLILWVVSVLWGRFGDRRIVQMADGSWRLIQQPALDPDGAIRRHALGRAIAAPPLRDSFWNLFATPWDPADPDPVDSRFVAPTRMTEDSAWDDFPAIATPTTGSSAWAAWISFSGQQDQLRLAQWHPEPGAWGTWNPVPSASGELWRPAAIADEDRVWVVWSQRIDDDYDLFGRAFDGQAWGPLERLSDAPGADFDPRLARGPDGALHLVWQALGDGGSDVRYRVYRDGHWSPALTVSTEPANDWEPAVAVDSKGTAWVVWDSYAANHYDVLMRSILPSGRLGDIRPIANTAHYEARPTVAVDAKDRVWVAWEAGPVAWAKGWGAVLPAEDDVQGTRIYEARWIEVAVVDGDALLAPRQPLSAVVHPQVRNNTIQTGEPLVHQPQLIVDRQGRVHLVYRQYRTQGFYSQYWTAFLTTMTDRGWTTPVPVPYSEGRLSMRPEVAPGPDGIWIAWPRDNYPSASTWIDLPEETLIENVYTARFEPGTTAGDDLAAWEPPEVVDTWDHRAEREAVDRIRAYRAQTVDESYRIVRGDLHRHTELSPDLRGAPDGSMLDLYRYMLDAAHLDFGAQTDHQGGGDRLYWWWLARKGTDLFTHARFTAMHAYERSVSWPHGHRNVIFEDRGLPPIPLFQPGPLDPAATNHTAWFRSHTEGLTALEEDTLYLFEELSRSGAITIPHTTASLMGTDWRYNDPEVEVGVEIFQGDRFSYEHAGAPLTIEEPDYAAGFVHEALGKGYWLGFTASSDHFSTHVSYANLFVKEPGRSGIMEALRARRTYAATDEIVLDVQMDGQLMGARLSVPEVPPLHIHVQGTGPLAEVVVFRDEQIVHRATPTGATLDLVWTDPAPLTSGEHRYYVRVQQTDQNMAWASPHWVTIEAEEPPVAP